LALGLLGSDARYAGHIFVMSDRNSFPSNPTSWPPLWSVSPTTVHSVAVRGLVQMRLLKSVRTMEGSLMEFRDARRDNRKLALMVGYLATNVLAWDIVYSNDIHWMVFSSSSILHSRVLILARKIGIPRYSPDCRATLWGLKHLLRLHRSEESIPRRNGSAPSRC
jgi:hypothetical protein